MKRSIHVSESGAANRRLDLFLAEAAGMSRSQAKTLIKTERVTLNGATGKPNQRIQTGDTVAWTPEGAVPDEPQPTAMALDILFEDAIMLALNKPPGLVVHPAPGYPSGTLLNGLLHHHPAFRTVERAGIVHRLDKETSGVLVAAKTDEARAHLQAQFKARTTVKRYMALAWGTPPKTLRIENALGRHPVHRKKQAVLKTGGRTAVSNMQVLEQFGEAALVQVSIETGRTHQVRVHLAHLNHPVVGDALYGRHRRTGLPVRAPRHLLHAAGLGISHPATGKRFLFEAPLPDDMLLFLEQLRGAQE